MNFRPYKFNSRIFFYVSGSCLLLLSGMFLLSSIVGLLYGERESVYFAYAFAIVALIGGLVAYGNRNFHTNISKKDGRLIVGLMWILIPLFGALPYAFDAKDFTLTDAIFESYSGYTTTGASILDDVESVSKAVLFYRSFTQWIGGLGFAILVIMFVRNFPEGAKNLFNAEFNSIEKEKDRPHIKNTVYKIFFLYLFFSIVCCILLSFGEMSVFEAVCNTFATISTGGFSISNGNMGAYSDYSRNVVMVFMFLSGISYFLLIWLARGKFKKVFKDEQLQYYCSIILVCSLLLALYFVFVDNMSFFWGLKDALFYIISTLSTTGFDLKVSRLGLFASTFLILLMFIGGCSASSSTGLKIIRLITLLKYIPVAIKRMFHPRAIIPVRYNGKALRDDEVSLVFGFFFLFFVIFLLGIMLLTVAGNSLLHSIALSAASVSNVGPIMGSVAEGFSYSALGAGSKSVLIVLMLLGRLEIYALIAVVSPTVWKRD